MENTNLPAIIPTNTLKKVERKLSIIKNLISEIDKDWIVDFFLKAESLFLYIVCEKYPFSFESLNLFTNVSLRNKYSYFEEDGNIKSLKIDFWFYLSLNRNIVWSSKLIEKYENHLNWDVLSNNEKIPFTNEIILQFKHKWTIVKSHRDRKYGVEMSRSGLSENINVKWNDVLISNLNDLINWKNISSSPINWSIELIEEKNVLLDWNRLSANPKLPWSESFFYKYIDKWDWYVLSENECIPCSLNLINQHINKWNWHSLSKNKGLPWSIDLIEKFEDVWNWITLSDNEYLPWSFELIDFFKNKWCWMNVEDYEDDYGSDLINHGLTVNKALPWSIELIEKYQNLWDWEYLSSNKALPWSWELIEKFKNLLNWESGDFAILFPWTFEQIEMYKNRNFWERLSSNEKIDWSIELIEKYKDKWDWGWSMSMNNSLPWSIEFVEKYKTQLTGNSKNSSKSADLFSYISLPWSKELLLKYENNLFNFRKLYLTRLQ